MARHHNKNREMLKAHQYTTKQAMQDIREKVLASFSGSLATICRDGHPVAGYPVSSVVPFVLDTQFRPIIYTASVAEHTLNVLGCAKASLFLRDECNSGRDVQTNWRICIIGDLLPVPEQEMDMVSEHYFAYYPEARNYDSMHDFLFFRLEALKYRVIMGFGDIRWVAGYAPFEDCPFTEQEKKYMMDHMNDDHVDAMRKYLVHEGITVDDSEVVMTDLHQYGFVLRHQGQLHFIPFEESPTDALSVRKTLVAMAKR